MFELILFYVSFGFTTVGLFLSLIIESNGGLSEYPLDDKYKIIQIISLVCFYGSIFLALVGVEKFYPVAKFAISCSIIAIGSYASNKLKNIFSVGAILISVFTIIIIFLQNLAYAPLTKEIWMTVEALFLVCKFFLLFGVGNTKGE